VPGDKGKGQDVRHEVQLRCFLPCGRARTIRGFHHHHEQVYFAHAFREQVHHCTYLAAQTPCLYVVAAQEFGNARFEKALSVVLTYCAFYFLNSHEAGGHEPGGRLVFMIKLDRSCLLHDDGRTKLQSLMEVSTNNQLAHHRHAQSQTATTEYKVNDEQAVLDFQRVQPASKAIVRVALWEESCQSCRDG
jgi:hypothetical protein